MAAVLTGTPVEIDWAAGADPAGQSITIPADATQVLMFWAYAVGSSGNGLSSSTLNSAAPTRVFELASVSTYECAIGVATWDSPATGSQTLDVAWDVAPEEGPSCIVAFVKDGFLGAPTDVDAAHATGSTAVTTTLTAVVGDLVLKFDVRYNVNVAGNPALSSGWTNGQVATTGVESSRLSYISASGTSQVCDSETEDYSAVVAISIPPAAAGGDATANGQTLTATGSLIAGSASATNPNATANGQTLTATAAIVRGFIESFTPNDIFLFGDTSSLQSSAGGQRLIGGFVASSSGATANGQTLTATASLTAGSATGQSNATASGQTLTATASLVAGTAFAGASAAGQTLTATASLIAGGTSATSAASGQTLTATASFIPGSASGGGSATAAGQTLTATGSLITGTAGADSLAAGAVFTSFASLLEATGSASSSAPAQILVATASLVPGSASGTANQTVTGQTLTAAAQFFPGGAFGPSTGTPRAGQLSMGMRIGL